VIVLVGFMGAGKTTVGNLLATRLGLPFADSDQVIEEQSGRPVRQIFAEDGEPAFRALEHETIARLLAAEHPRTQARLTADPGIHVIYLQVGYDQALQRVGGDAGRPMLARPDLPGLYERRRSVYAAVATLEVATEGRHPETITDDIAAQLVRVPATDGRAPRSPLAP